MKYRLLILSLITIFAFAGAALAEKAASGMEVVAPAAVAAVAPQAAQSPGADASCATQEALPFVTNPFAEATAKSCTIFECRQQCVCPGCFRICVDIQTCECECICQ